LAKTDLCAAKRKNFPFRAVERFMSPAPGINPLSEFEAETVTDAASRPSKSNELEDMHY